MPEIIKAIADNAKLTFAVVVQRQRYGDGKEFPEYRVLFRDGGQVVGVEDGPRRKHASIRMARLAGNRRVAQLRKHRLYVIRVTDKHIDDGEARECSACAIAQALWHNQERMGFPKWFNSFDVEPYAGFGGDPLGIVMRSRSSDTPDLMSGVGGMPDVVTQSRKHGYYADSMMEWAMGWDDWADARHMTLEEYRQQEDDPEAEPPPRPSPCSFVLDLDALKAQPEEVTTHA